MSKPEFDLDTLLRIGRDEAEPTQADRRAVRAGVIARLGVTAGAGLLARSAAATTQGGTASGASAGMTGALAIKNSVAGLVAWFVAGAALGTGATAIAVATTNDLPPAPPGAVAARTASSSTIASSPPTPAPSGPASLERDALPDETAVSESVRPPSSALGTLAGPKLRPDGAPSRITPPGPSPTLEAEARSLADVQRALRDNRPGEALHLLREQERAFQGGALGEERAAARVFALCAAGDGERARALAVQFLWAHPASPFADRVRTTCAR